MGEPSSVTLSGFAIMVTGFIPIPKNDLRKQAEIPLLLLDVQEGKRPAADIIPLLKDMEIRQQHINKRFTPEQVAAMADKPAPEPEAEKKQTEGGEAGGQQSEPEVMTATEIRKRQSALNKPTDAG